MIVIRRRRLRFLELGVVAGSGDLRVFLLPFPAPPSDRFCEHCVMVASMAWLRWFACGFEVMLASPFHEFCEHGVATEGVDVHMFCVTFCRSLCLK